MDMLQHYAPSFLPTLQTHLKTTTLSLEHFIQHSPLHGIQKVLYHEHQHTVRRTFSQYAPAAIMPILDSLLSPLTSIPIASMSRRTTTNRIPNPEFRLLLQRKLRLPIFSPSLHPPRCNCRTKPLLDQYGDHLFSCTSASKTPLHNHVRDSLYHILHRLGPIANLVRTSSDIILEPPNLLPTYPTLRPADIGIQLIPTPNYHSHQQPNPYLAIDVTFTHTPLLSSESSDSHLPPETKPIQQVHDVSTKQKYNVPHAHHLQQQGIALLPFTIDHLGGLGFQATNFLFGHHAIFLPVHSEPSWTTQNFRTNPPAIDLYHFSKTHIPQAILSKATRNWNQRSSQSTRFGSTYHTYTPESWATQALALNLTKALLHHLLTHIRRIQTFEAHQRKIHKQLSLTQPPPYYLPPPPFLLPSDSPPSFLSDMHQDACHPSLP
jgi:hypothetical protein